MGCQGRALARRLTSASHPPPPVPGHWRCSRGLLLLRMLTVPMLTWAPALRGPLRKMPAIGIALRSSAAMDCRRMRQMVWVPFCGEHVPPALVMCAVITHWAQQRVDP